MSNICVYLGWNLQKTIVAFEVSTLEFVKNEFLTHTVNFGIASAFSKGPGSTFSEDPCTLCKVCRFSEEVNSNL